jgi:hypothetical protein
VSIYCWGLPFLAHKEDFPKNAGPLWLPLYSISTMLSRLGRIPTCNVHKWIHTSAYLRMPKPHTDPAVNLLNASTTMGRQRSTKLKRAKAASSTSLPGKKKKKKKKKKNTKF